MDGVKWKTSGFTDTLLQESDTTENVEKITFAAGEGNKLLGIYLWTKTLNSYHFPLFTVVKLNLIVRTEQHLFITVQYVHRNSDVKIEE